MHQRPQTAKGVLFLSLEAESRLLDLVVKPAVYARLRTILRGAPLLVIAGVVQRAATTTSVLVHSAQAIT